MKRLWGILMLFVCVGVAAQSTRIKGKVLDAGTLEPLPFVGVYFDGTTIGISTDLEGNFALETRSRDVSTLTAHLLGYESQSIQITPGTFSNVTFRLKQDWNQLNAATVKPDDRYIRSILDRIDRARDRHNPERGPDWTADLYSRMEVDATNMEDIVSLGIFKDKLKFVLDYKDTSAITGKSFIPIMISENQSRKYHVEPEINKELMISSRISGVPQDNFLRQFTGSYLLSTNFYDATIHIYNLDVPSPAARSSRAFYNYFLVDSLMVDGRKTYTLRFHPKKLVTSPVMDGELSIDAEDFAIRSVHAQLANQANVNWVRHINVDIENERLPDGKWFFKDERLFLDLAVSLNDNSKIVSMLARRQLHYSNPDFSKVTEKEILADSDPVIVKHSVEKSPEEWEQIRPFELTEREKGVFDMVERIEESKAFKWTYSISEMFVTGFLENKNIGLGYGPWARTITFNGTEGLRLQVGGKTLKEFSKFIRLYGYLGYGFKDKKFKWDSSVEFIFRRDKTRKLTLSARNDWEQLGRGSGIFGEENIFNSLFAQGSYDRRSLARQYTVKYEHEWTTHFNNYLSLRHFRLLANDEVPLIRPDGSYADFFTVNELHYNARFSWDERVNRGFFTKMEIFTRFPIITLDIAGAMNGISPEDYKYLRSELTFDWRISAGAIGFGMAHINGGAIWGSIPYPLLKLHEGNQTYFLDKAAFSCMDYYEFASDRWVTAFYEHNFNGFFLGKIPLIKKLDLREIVTARAAWGTLTPQNRENAPYRLMENTDSLEKPYFEVGVGLGNIFRMLRVDCFWRLNHLSDNPKRNFAFNIGLDMAF